MLPVLDSTGAHSGHNNNNNKRTEVLFFFFLGTHNQKNMKAWNIYDLVLFFYIFKDSFFLT